MACIQNVRYAFDSSMTNSSSTEILREININSTEYEEIKTLLLIEPESLVAYYFIDNFIRWLSFSFYKFDEDEYWSDAAKIKIYCPEGKVEFGIIFTIVEYKNGRIFVMVYCMESKNYYIIKHILLSTKILNWAKSLTFEGVQVGLVPILKEVLLEKQIGIKEIYEKVLLAMPTTLALQTKLECPPEDIFVDRVHLKRTHIKFVNDHWEEKGEDTMFLIEALIRNSRSAGIYLRSDPIFPQVWSLRQHYGGIGMINSTIQQEHREREFLQILIRFMVKYAVIDGIKPFTCILKYNEYLIQEFSRAAFNKITNLFWITTNGTTGYRYISYFEQVQF